MTAVSRSFEVTYAGVTVSGAPYMLHGPIRKEKTYERLQITFRVVVSGGLSNIENLEEAFRKPRQTLVIKDGASTETYQVSDGSGFNAIPSIVPIESEFEGPQSREFECSVAVDLPADAPDLSDDTGTSGLRDYTWEVTTLPTGRRFVQLSGEYTPISDGNAKAQYEAMIDALAEDVLELADPSLDPDDDWDTEPLHVEVGSFGTIARWSRSYTERLRPQKLDGTNFAGLDNVRVRIAPTVIAAQTAPGPTPQRPVEVSVTWDCDVKSSVTTDLKAVWQTQIRAEIRSLVAAFISSTTPPQFRAAVVDYDHFGNRISVRARLVGYGPGEVLAFQTSSAISETPPFERRSARGGGHAKVLLPAAGSLIRSRSAQALALSASAASKAVQSFLKLNEGPFYEDVAVEGVTPGRTATPDSAYEPDDAPGFGAENGAWIQVAREGPAGRDITDYGDDPGEVPITFHMLAGTVIEEYVTDPNLAEG